MSIELLSHESDSVLTSLDNVDILIFTQLKVSQCILQFDFYLILISKWAFFSPE